MKNGYTFVELLIVVAILGILASVAYPLYRDYILRVRIAEAINDMTILIRDAQIAFGTGELATSVDLTELSKKAGVQLESLYGCTNGFRKAMVVLPKNKLHFIGITYPYIYEVSLYGLTTTPCTGTSFHDDSIDLYFSLDTEELGLSNKSGDKAYNILELSVSTKVIYKDLSGKTIKVEAGSVLSCGIFPRWGGSLANFDVKLSALPQGCRYHRIAGVSPRELIELNYY